MYNKDSKQNIYVSSIKRAVENNLQTDDEASILRMIDIVNELLMISIRKGESREQLKDYIAKKIEG